MFDFYHLWHINGVQYDWSVFLSYINNVHIQKDYNNKIVLYANEIKKWDHILSNILYILASDCQCLEEFYTKKPFCSKGRLFSNVFATTIGKAFKPDPELFNFKIEKPQHQCTINLWIMIIIGRGIVSADGHQQEKDGTTHENML